MKIHPTSDLWNDFDSIEKTVTAGKPVFLAEEGYDPMVLISIEEYSQLINESDLLLAQAEEYAKTHPERLTHEEVFGSLQSLLQQNQNVKDEDEDELKAEEAFDESKCAENSETDLVTMEDIFPFILSGYDQEVIEMIHQKYGFDYMTAMRKFLFSETSRMLSDPELEMWEFASGAIFDMWEVEQIAGDPRLSLYISIEGRDV